MLAERGGELGAGARTTTSPPSSTPARRRISRPAPAEAVRSDRSGVIAQARTEWATDSTDENLAAMCAKLDANVTDEQRAQAPKMEACVAESTCAAYTACAMPLMATHFAR